VVLNALSVVGFRNIDSADLLFSSDNSFLYGPNGAGKTSLLEAVFLLTNGKSFRGGGRQSLVGEGSSGVALRGLVRDDKGINSELRAVRYGKDTKILLNGTALRNRSQLLRHVPVLAFSQETLSRQISSSGSRRNILDWCLFHVEPGYHTVFEEYRSVLSHYNAALRKGIDIGPWVEALVGSGIAVHKFRMRIGQALQDRFDSSQGKVVGLPAVALEYKRGWPEEATLPNHFAARAKEHQRLGYCSSGPHRGDLRIRGSRGDALNWASRGQIKAYYYLLFIAMLDLVKSGIGIRPIALIDDLWSEFDSGLSSQMVDITVSNGGQSIFTGIERRKSIITRHRMGLFHVEQGSVALAIQN